MRGAPRRGMVAAMSVVLLLAGCSGSADSDDQTLPELTSSPTPTASSPIPADVSEELRPYYEQRLRWSGCDGRYECATLRVPLDYDAPAGADTEVAVIRLPADNPGARIGSLLINPGGPGGSGIEYARAARAVITDAVRQRYDIVGFDPRGVSESAPITCRTDEELDVYLAADASPDDAEEEQQAAELQQQLGPLCAERAGPLLAEMSTRDVARDMDILRAVLGDAQLHYLGKSYGTFLGATYAELFPDRAGRLVLDGAIDPLIWGTPASPRGQVEGFERALGAFVEACVASSCSLGGSPRVVANRIDAFLAEVDTEPLEVGDRLLTQSLATLGIIYSLYDQQSWPYLITGLERAYAGDGSVLLLLADAYSKRQSDGTYVGNQFDAQLAVNCLDRPATVTSVDEVRALAAEFEAISPRFGEVIAWSELACASWPVPAVDEARPITADGAPPILVVGTTRDPATPYEWAESLAEQLSSGVLLSYEGDGHTAYATGSACVDAAVDAFLLDGTVPANGKRCAPA